MIDTPNSTELSNTIQPRAFERNILGVAKGGGITFVSKLFLTAIRFVLAVVLARFLGAEQYGFYTLALSAAALCTGIGLLGMDDALVRYVAIAASRRDEPAIWGTLQISIGMSLALSTLLSTGLFALAYPIAELAFGEPALAPLLQLTAAIIPFLTLLELLASAIRGFKRMDYSALAQFIAQPVVRLALTLVLALGGLNAFSAVIVYGLAGAAASLILLYFLNREFALRRPLHTAHRQTRSILGFALPFWLSDLIVTFQGNLQTLLVGSLSSIAGAGIFAMADQLNSLGNLFSSSINVSSRPLIAELHDRDDREQLGQVYQTAAKWSLSVNLPIFLTTVLFAAPILSIFGDDFTVGASTLVILACANLANVGTGMGGIILDMAGYTKLKLMNSVGRLVLHLGLNLLLIPPWGIIGAAVSVLVTEGLINLVRLLEVYILMKLLPYNRSFFKPVVAGVAALAGVMFAGQWLPGEANLLYTALLTLLLVTIYGCVILLLGLSPLERSMLASVGRRARGIFSRS